MDEITLTVTKRQIAYLLGGVGVLLQRSSLQARDRDALAELRDLLMPHLNLAPDIKLALQVAETNRLH
jgi:hypothetical protein